MRSLHLHLHQGPLITCAKQCQWVAWHESHSQKGLPWHCASIQILWPAGVVRMLLLNNIWWLGVNTDWVGAQMILQATNRSLCPAKSRLQTPIDHVLGGHMSRLPPNNNIPGTNSIEDLADCPGGDIHHEPTLYWTVASSSQQCWSWLRIAQMSPGRMLQWSL